MNYEQVKPDPCRNGHFCEQCRCRIVVDNAPSGFPWIGLLVWTGLLAVLFWSYKVTFGQ